MSRFVPQFTHLLETRVLPSAVLAARVAAGADTTAILATVNEFRNDLGTAQRRLDWDQPADTLTFPKTLPGEYFNTTSPQGAILRSSGTGFAISPASTKFTTLEPTYAGQFPSFNGTRLFTPIGGNQTVVDFFLAGTRTPATVNGFGAVFADVDLAGATTVTFFGTDGAVLHEQKVPVAKQGLSFVGVTFGSAIVSRVRIVSGTTAPAAGIADSESTDVVVMDDFFFGEPTSITFDVPNSQRITSADQLTFSSVSNQGIELIRSPESVNLSLSVTSGTLRLAETEGLAFTEGDGTDDRAVAFSGSRTAINGALDGLTYTPTRNFTGADMLTISADGGAATSRIAITVEADRVDQNDQIYFATTAGPGGSSQVFIHNSDGSQRATVNAELPGGARVALAELSGDGRPELVAAAGPGGAPWVRVFDGGSGKEAYSFLAYEEAFTGGIYVTLADLNGDGLVEIITSPDEGGGPRVRVFDGKSQKVLADFLAIEDPNFRGGARVATGDLNGDGVADLLVGAGFGGGPRLAVFNGRSLTPGFVPEKLFGDFFVFEESLRNGVFLTSGDINADGFDDVIVGGGPGGGPRVIVLDASLLMKSKGADRVPLANFFAGDSESRGGVRLAVKDLDGDRNADILTATGTDTEATVLGYSGSLLKPDSDAKPTLMVNDFPADFRGGVFVG